MELFALCKSAMLAIVLTDMNFANGSSTNEAATVLLNTVIISHESSNAEVGVAIHKPESDYLVSIAAEQTKVQLVAPSRRHLSHSVCKLNTECFNKKLENCNFKGCQFETKLILRDKKLSGPLPTKLSEYLPVLSELDLSHNELNGSIEALASLTDLTKLDLSRNKFQGSIDALEKLIKLTKLNMSSNQLKGSVAENSSVYISPTSCTDLGDDLSSDRSIFNPVAKLAKLELLQELDLSDNWFKGSIEPLGHLKNLIKLDISINDFEGSVEALGNLARLEELVLFYNNFRGSFHILGHLKNLIKLKINFNCFSGTIDVLGNLVRLEELDLSHNFINGSKGASGGSLDALGKLIKLTKLDLSYNRLKGSIDALVKLTRLTKLDLSNNEFKGSIGALAKLTNLTKLYLSDNRFKGSIGVLGKLVRITSLDLSNNEFKGSIGALAKLTNLAKLDLSDNEFVGKINSLENLPQLVHLSLSNMGKAMVPPIPDNVFELASDDIVGLNLACGLQQSDLHPLGKHGKLVFQIGESTNLKCNARFPILSDGNWAYKTIKSGHCSSACPDNKPCAVIATQKECKKAWGMDVLLTTERILPYCYEHKHVGYFDSTGMEEDQGEQSSCSENYPCICKQAVASNETKCTYDAKTKKARWSPDISKHVCLGQRACKVDDSSARWLKEKGVDVSNCSSLQDGSSCTNYRCTRHQSLIHARHLKIRCMREAWERLDIDYCTFCPAGEHKVDMWSCEACEEGKYLISGEEKDDDIEECKECTQGQYQEMVGQAFCKPCSDGYYQDDTGATGCKTCTSWVSNCPEGAKKENFKYWLIIVLAALALVATVIILGILKLFCHLNTKVRTIWKPQSAKKALRAKSFVLPKTCEVITPSVEVFKDCLEHFVEKKGWSTEQKATILEHRNIVVTYLGQRVEEAADPKAQSIMRCCLKMDVLHDFKTLYDATMMNIRNKERDGFQAYNAIMSELQAHCSVCPPNASDLMELYETGRVAYPLFHAFIAKAASASDTAYLFKSHGKQPGMKGLYRVLEKAVFKYNDDIKNLNFGAVRDLVRGGIIDTKMDGLAKVAEYIFNSTEVTVCRIKDRFNEPSSAGWTDLMINFYLNNDPDKHVCEVQLIHFKMLSQRTTQEGHDAYNVHRAAAELLQKSSKMKKSQRKIVFPESKSNGLLTHVIPVVCVYVCFYFGFLFRYTCANASHVFVQFLLLPTFACDFIQTFFEQIYCLYTSRIPTVCARICRRNYIFVFVQHDQLPLPISPNKKTPHI